MKEERRYLVYEVMRLLGRGQSQRAVARALGIAPRTVARIQKEQEQRQQTGESALERELPARRAPRGSKLDSYVQQIEAWVEEFPDLRATRLHEKLTEVGFEGGYTIVREYLQKLHRRRAPPVAFQVVETPPGHQAQFDWSPYQLSEALHVDLWSCTLSWSRARSFAATDNARQTTILERLTKSFERFGGVPYECVTDTMPGVVDRWECGRPLLNVRFVDFAAYYRFAVHIAPRRTPRYKGKVERPFRHVEENLLNGRRFHSLAEFAEVLAWWQDERAMQRPHPVTGEPLVKMLDQERPHLQPLPVRPYDTRDVVQRLVDPTGHIQYETNKYRVKDRYIGELLYVCVGPKQLEVFDRGVHRVAQWERLADGAGQRHPGDERAPKTRYDVELLLERVAAWGPVAEDFAQRLRDKKRYPGPELSHILSLQLTFSADDIVRAMEHARDYDAYDARAVERILAARFAPRRLSEQLADTTRRRIREVMAGHPVEQRSLQSYDALRTGDPPVSTVSTAEDDSDQPRTDDDDKSP